MNLEDYVVSLQLYNKTDKIYFCNTPMYHYLSRKGSLSKSGFFAKKMSVLETSENIRKYFVDEEATKDIISGVDHFVFRMYASIFWEIYKYKPQDWKALIRKWEEKSLQVFRRFVKNADKQKGDWKRVIQFFLVLLSARL